MNRRLPPIPFTPADNPWTRGLVFFTVLDSAYTPFNYVLPGGGTASTPSGQEIVSGITGYPGLNFNASNNEYIDWDRDAIGAMTGGGATVIARVNPTAGTGAVGSIFGTYQDGPKNGFMLYFNDAGGADEGLAFIVGEAGSILYSSSGTKANYSGYEYTAAGRYNSFTRTTSVWQDGIKLDEDTDLGTAWLTTATNFLHTGRIPNTSDRYGGNCYWIAVFNRELTDEEMVVWQTTDPLDLILPPPSIMVVPNNISFSCSNVVLVTDEAAGENTYSITTALIAGANLAGDLSSSPPVPPVFSGLNEVLVVGSTNLVETVLMSTRNVVLVTDAADTFEPFSGANEVLVGDRSETRIGNQLVAGRYKR